MVDWNKKFKPEYDYARGWLKPEDYAEQWRSLVRKLARLMADDGFDTSEAAALGDLRKLLARSTRPGQHGTEDRALLDAVGAWRDDPNAVVEDRAKMRAAALKLLRHVYLVNKSGKRKTWLVSLPTAFQDWPSDDFNTRAHSQNTVRSLLASTGEIFSEERKNYLAASTTEALAWCQKTTAVLALAAKGVRGKGSSEGTDALRVVHRWFADPATTDADMQARIDRLHRGFKDIIAVLGRGHLVLTDWVPLRTASTQDELNFLNSEAFTFASGGEGMDVIYIESSFFVDHPGNVLKGQKNWTRIVVHELTHLVCGTQDVNIGNARYAWYGIGPHSGFPGSAAINNADSWAFFCVDCSGQLTESERSVALKIV